MMTRRKRIYEAMHPETKATSDGGGGRHNATRRQLGDDIADRFTSETAKVTGKSERSVQRDAQREVTSLLRRIVWECGWQAVALYVSSKRPRRGRKPAPGNTISLSVKSDVLDGLIAKHGHAAIAKHVDSLKKSAGRPRKIQVLNQWATLIEELAFDLHGRGCPNPIEQALIEAQKIERLEGRSPSLNAIKEYYSRACGELSRRDSEYEPRLKALADSGCANPLAFLASSEDVPPFILSLRIDRARRRKKV